MTTPAPPSREAEIAARLKAGWYDLNTAQLGDVSYLLAQLQQAREALTKYGVHQGVCASGGFGDVCVCGLDAAMKAVR